jgi:hypothetical protein
MMVYGGVKINLHIFLTLTLDGYGWSASRFGCLSPEKELRYLLNRRGSGCDGEEKNPCPGRESNTWSF